MGGIIYLFKKLCIYFWMPLLLIYLNKEDGNKITWQKLTQALDVVKHQSTIRLVNAHTEIWWPGSIWGLVILLILKQHFYSSCHSPHTTDWFIHVNSPSSHVMNPSFYVHRNRKHTLWCESLCSFPLTSADAWKRRYYQRQRSHYAHPQKLHVSSPLRAMH